MLPELFARGGRREGLPCAALEIVLENVFGGARLAGDFAKAQEKRLGEASAADAKDADGLLSRGALENNGVEIGAGALAVVFDGGAERVAVRVKELYQPLHFGVVFLLGAAGKARREAHFHFGIDAAGESGIAANFDLTAAHFEEIERLLGKSECRFPGREGPIVSAG